MKKLAFHIFNLTAIFYVISCSPVRNLTIEIPAPGKENLPVNIQSLTLINRCVDKRFSELNEGTTQNYFFESDLEIDTFFFDIAAADTIIKALGNLMFESGRYDIVIPENRFPFINSEVSAKNPLSWEEVEHYDSLFKTNAVLSLEDFNISISSEVEAGSVWDYEMAHFFRVYYAKIKINSSALFNIYDPIRERVLNSFIRDTLFWDYLYMVKNEKYPEQTYWIKCTILKRLPTIKKVLTESAINLASIYSSKISNQWQPENRNYFSLYNYDAGITHKFVKLNEWEKAMEMWQNLLKTTKQKRLKSKAQYNLAVGSEIMGNISEAKKWCMKSYETSPHPLTLQYLDILKKRESEIEKYSK